jgi:hypothetical protein
LPREVGRIPDVTATAATALARLFRVMSRLRGRRSLHPLGVGYEGRLEITGDRRWPGVPLLERSAAHPALVRCSRAAGLPEPLPDVLGIAVKLPGAYGDGGDQDLLFSSAPDQRVLRGVLLPARSFLRGAFSTLLPYRVGGRRVVLWLRPDPKRPGGRGRAFAQLERAVAGTAVYELWVGGGLRRPRAVGRLVLTRPLDGADELRFHPWTTGPGLRPSGWLNRLRRPSYAASQAGWSGEATRGRRR